MKNTSPIVETLLTYKAAGQRLGVTDRTVWALVDRGELPAVRFGRSVRIDPVDLQVFIEQGKSQPPNRRQREVSDAE